VPKAYPVGRREKSEGKTVYTEERDRKENTSYRNYTRWRVLTCIRRGWEEPMSNLGGTWGRRVRATQKKHREKEPRGKENTKGGIKLTTKSKKEKK